MRRFAFPILVLLAPAAFADPGPRPREVRLDRDGDILPEGAVSRLGSRLFRDPGAERLYVEDGGRIAACFQDSAVRWWDLETGRCLRGWAEREKRSVWFSPNGRLVGRAMPDGLEVRDAWNDRPIRTVAVDDPKRLIVAFSQNGRQVAVATDDDIELGSYRVRVCDLASGREHTLNGLQIPPALFWFADAGRMLVIQTKTYQVIGWEIGRETPRWQVEADDLRFDRTGRWFIGCVSQEGKFTLFDSNSGRQVPHKHFLWQFASPRDILDVSSDGGNMLRISNGERPTVVWSWFRPKDENETRVVHAATVGRPVKAGAFTSDGRRIVMLADQRLHVYHIATHKRLTPDLPGWGQPRELEGVYWSADGCYVVTATSTESPHRTDLLAWDPVTGRVAELATRRENERERRRAAMPYKPEPRTQEQWPIPRDTDGRWLPLSRTHTYPFNRMLVAIARMQGERGENDPEPTFCNIGGPRPRFLTPSIVEAHTGRPLVTLPIRHPGQFAFSPDARSLAVIEPDSVHLYDVITGREQLVRKVPMYPHGDATMPCGLGLSFSPDGTRLAVIEHGGAVLVLDVALPRTRTPLADGELDRLWVDLASPDPKIGWAAVFRSSDHPDETVKTMRSLLTAVREPAGVGALVRGLGSDDFRVREKSFRQLQELGDAARPSIAAALNKASGPESRQRLEALQAALADDQPPLAADLQRLRALAVLERAGTKEARAKIEELANGLTTARVTLEAKQAVRRLADRERPWKD